MLAVRAQHDVGGDAAVAVIAADPANMQRLLRAADGTDPCRGGKPFATTRATHAGCAHTHIVSKKGPRHKWRKRTAI